MSGRVRARHVAAAIAAALMCVASVAGAYQFRSAVVANGASPPAGMTNGTQAMHATAGQSVVGASGAAGRVLVHGFWARGGVLMVGVNDGPPAAALTLALSAPRPNPTRAGVSFTLAIPAAGDVRLEVFDLQGRAVDRVVGGALPAGMHTLRWNAAVHPGVYLARLSVDGRRVAERRVSVIR